MTVAFLLNGIYSSMDFYFEEVIVYKYTALFLFFWLCVSCGKVDRSMEAELTVLEPLVLQGENPDVLETIPEGGYPVTLKLESERDSKGRGRIVLNMEDKRFVFAISSKELLRLATKKRFVGSLLAEDSGQSYDLRLMRKYEVTNGPLYPMRDVYCLESSHFPRSGFPRAYRSYHYKKTIDDRYHIVFLEPGDSDGAGVARLTISEQRVETHKHPIEDCF